MSWYQDAVIYEVPIRSFFDGNDDGIGDFLGLEKKLDYFVDLGVTALWLLPFFSSPLKDDGYDIADYQLIHPQYGSLKDFKSFLEKAHEKGLKVIIELVLNHTSIEHPWFEKARNAPKDSSDRLFYVWSDSPDKYLEARIIFSDFETSNWTWDPIAKQYYWHRFYAHQPDLNYDHPPVKEAMFDVLGFWMDLGVDGIRLDAVPYLYEKEATNCENLEETHAFLKELRAWIDEKYNDRMLLAEANQWPEDAAKYFGEGDECHMAFHFPMMPRLFMSIFLEDTLPILEIANQTPSIPKGCQWALFLRNHDELTLEMVTDEERDYMFQVYAQDPQARINLGIRRRLAPLLNNDRRKIELMYTLLFSLIGTPVIYYGDEIGMGDNLYLGDRNGVRTPMQWSDEKNAGFSKTNPQRLYLPVILDPEYHYETVNVATQVNSAYSLLTWIRQIISQRKLFKAFGRGSTEFLHPKNRKILVYFRKYKEEEVMIIINFSRFPQFVELDLSKHADFVPIDLFSGQPFPTIGQLPYFLTLGPYGCYWFLLSPPKIDHAIEKEKMVPKIKLKHPSAHYLIPSNRKNLFHFLLNYLSRRRWVQENLGFIDRNKSHFVDLLKIDHSMYLALIETADNQGLMRYIPLFFEFIKKDKAFEIQQNYSENIIIELLGPEEDENELLVDLGLEERLGKTLEKMLKECHEVKGEEGNLQIIEHESQSKIVSDYDETQYFGKKHYNKNIFILETAIAEVNCSYEDQPLHDAEMRLLLQKEGHFPYFIPIHKSIGYVNSKPVNSFIHYTDKFCYFDSTTMTFIEMADKAIVSFSSEYQRSSNTFIEQALGMLDPLISKVMLPMLELGKQLGTMVGQFHSAMEKVKDPQYAPVEFTLFYQNSLLQIFQRKLAYLLALVDIPEFKEKEKEYNDFFKSFFKKKLLGKRLTIHGDLTLDHIVAIGKDFYIKDFSPYFALNNRIVKIKRFCCIDLVSMIYSFLKVCFESTLRIKSRGKDLSWETGLNCALWVIGSFLRVYVKERNFDEPMLKQLDTMLFYSVFERGYDFFLHPQFQPYTEGLNLFIHHVIHSYEKTLYRSSS